VDEFAHMTQKVAGGTNPLAQELDEFINVYMRQHQIWFSAAHQELYQIDEQLRNTLLSLGTYILGSTSSMESARELADALFFRDPYWVKYWRPVYASLPQGVRGNFDPVLEPEFMPLEEQRELFAQQIKGLGRFQFLFRPAVAEGQIGSAVSRLTIRYEDCDPGTGEPQYPDPQLLARVRAVLAAQSGMSVQALLVEQESRLGSRRPLTRQEHRVPEHGVGDAGHHSLPALIRQPQNQDTSPQAPPVEGNCADADNASRPTRRRHRIGNP
jgi:hypothetical protein